MRRRIIGFGNLLFFFCSLVFLSMQTNGPVGVFLSVVAVVAVVVVVVVVVVVRSIPFGNP